MIPYTYIITYDLISPGQKYNEIQNVINNLSSACIHLQKSVWLIKSFQSPDLICDKLSTVIDNNDKLFVCELKHNYQGRQSEEDWKYIGENIL